MEKDELIKALLEIRDKLKTREEPLKKLRSTLPDEMGVLELTIWTESASTFVTILMARLLMECETDKEDQHVHIKEWLETIGKAVIQLIEARGKETDDE